MKHLIASIFAVLTVLLAALPNGAQQVVERRITPDSAVIMPEIGAVAMIEDGAADLSFATVFPREARPEENRDVDVKQGDVILMMNGERIRSIADLRGLYDGLEEGGEIKLGLKRGAERFLVTFAKGDGAMSHGGPGGMRVVVAGGDGGEVELLHEARALLGERDGEVRVIAQLPGGGGELEEDDVVEQVNGRAVASLAEYRDVYQALALGDALRLTVRRGEESVEVDVTKAEKPAGMMMMRGGQ